MAHSVVVRHRDSTVLGDITSICQTVTLTRRLNRPSSISFRVPSYEVADIQGDDYPLISAGNRQIALTLDSMGLAFHGVIWNIEEDGDEDMVYSTVTAYDPMILWRYRPARDDVDSYSGEAGNLSDPSFLERNQFGGPIMNEILTASESPARVGASPSLAEGQLWIDLVNSSFAGGGADLSGAPTNWPMTIAEIATLLTNTGELDIIIEPIIGSVGVDGLQNIAEVHTHTGDYGNDLTSSVHFDYATGDRNVRLFRRSENMDTIGNKIYYYLSRKDQQHWWSNVTRDHPGFLAYPSFPELETEISVSRSRYGVFMMNTTYENAGSGSGGAESSAYPLFLRQWMVESLVRIKPRNMVYLTPVRSGGAVLPQGGDIFEPGDFDIGDLVTVNIGNYARVAESGAQRIYAYTIEIDEDGVEALGEFQTSPDQDSI